jgi:hypothetical protein
MTTREDQDVRFWLTDAGYAALEGVEQPAEPEVHDITVTGGGPFGRAWFDCTCGKAVTHASKKAANDAALAHHREVVGCTCSREANDPLCLLGTARTTTPNERTP